MLKRILSGGIMKNLDFQTFFFSEWMRNVENIVSSEDYSKKARNAIIPRERGCTSQKISIVYSKEVEFCLGVGYSIKLKTWKPLNFDRTVL